MKIRSSAYALAVAATVALASAAGASADTVTANGTWAAYPGQATTSQTAVQQPINADGSSSFKATGKAVIPVKFSLAQGLGPFVFESIASDTNPDNDFSFLSFTPASPLTFGDVTRLASNYAFTTGDCHAGSLRWQVRTDDTHAVFIYYGAAPSFASCTGLDGQVNTNLIGQPDLRYDTSQYAGGTFYDSYAHALTLVGSTPILRASLVLDSGFAGDQRLTLNSATVNNDTFTPPAATALAPTCDLPPATIKVTKISGATPGAVNEVATVQPNDNDGSFRTVDCKYMYNLATSSLSGAGTYKVEVVIGAAPVGGAATFTLR